jgi:hypothetical protein
VRWKKQKGCKLQRLNDANGANLLCEVENGIRSKRERWMRE